MTTYAYKRFDSWQDLCAEEWKIVGKLKAEQKLRAMSDVRMRAVVMEFAMNRLSKDGWEVFLDKHPFGIFLRRELKAGEKAEPSALENIIGPEPGNKEAKILTAAKGP